MHTRTYELMPKKDLYGLKLLLSLGILLMVLAYTSLYLMQNYYSNSFFDIGTKKNIFFLKSDTLQDMYIDNNMDYSQYQKRVQYLENLAKEDNYNPKLIYSYELKKLPKNSTLVAMDMMSLTEKEINEITNFVNNGGNILFNFTSGFLNRAHKYTKENLVYKITDMKLDKNINTIKLKSDKFDVYMTTKLTSPFSKYFQKGYALDLNVYDPLPIFSKAEGAIPDTYLTNWPQTNYIAIKGSKELNATQSTLIWHGTKGKGKWVYFTFPSYVFLDSHKIELSKLYKSMLEYLNNPITIIAYPYIDAKNIVFVSEDTEYKYENLKQFYNVSLKYKFPVTAFCVAKLALKHKQLMKEVSTSKYLEIASHSYSHDKIVGMSDKVYKKETEGSKEVLEKLTGKKVTGFRAPREEIDNKLIKNLEDGGFHYVLNEGKNRLTPFYNDGILMIPRHATDDYSYLINLDWSSKEILQNMIKEVNTIVNLDGIYTLSTHTHLMNYGSNIKILDDFFKYIKEHKNMSPMNGEMIYQRLLQKKNISFTTNITQKKLIIRISNQNNSDVQNLHYEISVSPDIKLKNIESEIIGLKTDLKQITKTKYLLIVNSLKPKSQIALFINYAKNN